MTKTNSSLTTTTYLWLLAHVEVLANITAGLSSLTADPSAANLTVVAVHVGALAVELAFDSLLTRRARRLERRDERPGPPLRRHGTPRI